MLFFTVIEIGRTVSKPVLDDARTDLLLFKHSQGFLDDDFSLLCEYTEDHARGWGI